LLLRAVLKFGFRLRPYGIESEGLLNVCR